MVPLIASDCIYLLRQAYTKEFSSGLAPQLCGLDLQIFISEVVKRCLRPYAESLGVKINISESSKKMVKDGVSVEVKTWEITIARKRYTIRVFNRPNATWAESSKASRWFNSKGFHHKPLDEFFRQDAAVELEKCYQKYNQSMIAPEQELISILTHIQNIDEFLGEWKVRSHGGGSGNKREHWLNTGTEKNGFPLLECIF
jgi:hypothetical protein